MGARISRALHAQHYDRHQGKETGQTKAEAIDGHVAKGIFTVHLQRAARECAYCRGANCRSGVHTERQLLQRALQAGRECDGAQNCAYQQHEGVHETGRGGVLAGGAGRAAHAGRGARAAERTLKTEIIKLARFWRFLKQI